MTELAGTLAGVTLATTIATLGGVARLMMRIGRLLEHIEDIERRVGALDRRMSRHEEWHLGAGPAHARP